MSLTETPTTGMSISPSAARRIAELRAAESNPTLMLRVSVSGGGCSGFQYGFAFDDTINEDDQVFERGDVRIVVDSVSLDFLNGSELDYVEELLGSYFAVQNPNASSSCGCGTSFSI
ncbi:MAG: iron-sulfur cluster insertion protein ErpA [Alphaproteobacteria bacterium]|nr:iron-sulfur cluster insertion protein ErpA [Alphaproteobacteria bacterium]